IRDLYVTGVQTCALPISHHAIADAAGQLGAPGPADGDHERRRRLRQRVEPRVLHGVVATVVRLVAALPEQAQHLDGLREALLADGGLRPAPADDVLIEVLAGADAEKEAA